MSKKSPLGSREKTSLEARATEYILLTQASEAPSDREVARKVGVSLGVVKRARCRLGAAGKLVGLALDRWKSYEPIMFFSTAYCMERDTGIVRRRLKKDVAEKRKTTPQKKIALRVAAPQAKTGKTGKTGKVTGG